MAVTAQNPGHPYPYSYTGQNLPYPGPEYQATPHYDPQLQPRPARLKLENAAVALLVAGAVLIGAGLIVTGTAPGDIHIKEGSYEGGHSSAYRSGYSMGFYDGKTDQDDDSYHGYAYSGDYLSGDTLKGYNAGYDDGYYGRQNAIDALGYKPDISIGAAQAASVLIGTGVILEGLGAGFRIKAHFDQKRQDSGI